jgi:hypothetical protein
VSVAATGVIGSAEGLRAQTLNCARCVRARHLRLPGPGPDATLQIRSSRGSERDPNNPRYKAAHDACTKYVPGGGAGGSLSTSGAS